MNDCTSTFSAALAASPLPPAPTESEPCSSAKLTPDAAPFLPGLGPESPATTTCGLYVGAWPTPAKMDETEPARKHHHRSGNYETMLGQLAGLSLSGSSLPGFPVSQPLEQASSAERRMTAGSGRRLSALYQKSGPLGRCSRILLESETWASPEFSLKWTATGTKCGCLVFRLVPSARRTGGSGIGLWPTACQTDAAQTRNRTAQRSDPNSRHHDGLTLTDAISSWPTPPKRDDKGQTQNPERMDYVPNIVKATGATASGCLARTEKFVVRLMTLSAWLMGYTAAYLAHWETASSRRSRKESSPQ